jgi:hypothetical protein
MKDLYLIGFSRCPREFRAGLLEGPILQDCIEAMRKAGQSAELATGTKLFCKPECYASVRKVVESIGIEESLRPYHVLVTGELRSLVMQIVKSFPRALKVKLKEESVIARVGQSGKWIPVRQETVLSTENESAAPKPKQAAKDVSTTVKSQKPKKSKAKGAETELIGAGATDPSISLDCLLESFPVPAMDPAFAFPIFPPTFPALPGVDPALVRLMHEMEQQSAAAVLQQQKMFNEAFLLSTRAHQIFQASLIAEQQQQMKC